jgi:tetratricopeptide (TPR) repeat protein
MKIAACLIVKGDESEVLPLKLCLESITQHVDKVFITITQPNDKVKRVAEYFGAEVSQFEWCNDFSKARNFNFSQVPPEYDYIFWCDADDVMAGMENLRESIEKTNAASYLMYYQYAFDKYGMPIVVHQKTQVVKNDGTYEWKGKIHEDLIPNRDVAPYLITDVTRNHNTTDTRVKDSIERNLKIAIEQKTEDPRSMWNLANAYAGAGDFVNARKNFEEYLLVSGYDEEKYVALLRVSDTYSQEGRFTEAIEYAQRALGKFPLYPDAYYTLASIYYHIKNLDKAEEYMLQGLVRRHPQNATMVFNPRDYDYNPLMKLANIYWDKGRPDQSLICLEKCQVINPKNKDLKSMIDAAKTEAKSYEKVLKWAQKLKEMSEEKRKKEVLKIPKDIRNHPMMLYIRNSTIIKDTTSGKDVVYYCGYTTKEWTPDIVKEGIGGSEEAVIHLSRGLAKKGFNVTVYNNCPEEGVYDGVKYVPWYLYNSRDKQDVLIVWRNPKLLDQDLNVRKIYLDLHDVIGEGELTPKRLAKLSKIFVKSEAHRELFKNVPDEKFAIVPNGIMPSDFDTKEKRDPFLIINTSSPDRSASAFIRIFKKIKELEPRASMKWAYGWEVYESSHGTDKKRMEWKTKIEAEMKEAGIENLGKIGHADIAKLTKQAGVMLYPTHFYEIDCISVRKAQLGGCVPVTSNFAALKTTNNTNYKVSSLYDKDTWSPPYVFEFGDSEENDQIYINNVLEAFKVDTTERIEMSIWAKNFAWEKIVDKWYNELNA